MRERTRLETAIATIHRLRDAIDTNSELIELAEAEKDEVMIADAERSLGEARAEAAKARLETLLSGEADPNNCYVEVNAGAGGTEAQDWAEILARMYTRWAERKGGLVELPDVGCRQRSEAAAVAGVHTPPFDCTIRRWGANASAHMRASRRSM